MVKSTLTDEYRRVEGFLLHFLTSRTTVKTKINAMNAKTSRTSDIKAMITKLDVLGSSIKLLMFSNTFLKIKTSI